MAVGEGSSLISIWYYSGFDIIGIAAFPARLLTPRRYQYFYKFLNANTYLTHLYIIYQVHETRKQKLIENRATILQKWESFSHLKHLTSFHCWPVHKITNLTQYTEQQVVELYDKGQPQPLNLRNNSPYPLLLSSIYPLEWDCKVARTYWLKKD